MRTTGRNRGLSRTQCWPATTPPPLHTLYLDPPLKGALLIQTLARVNRTFCGNEDELLANRLVKAEVNPGPLNLSRGRGGVYRFHVATVRRTTSPSSPLTSLMTVASLFDNRRGHPSAPSPVEDTDVPCQVADAFRDFRRPSYAP